MQRALQQTAELVQRFLRPDDQSIRYVEYATVPDEGEKMVSLNAVPKDLPECLYNTLWSRGKPAILTSGTLAAGDGFSNTKRQLGLERGVPLRMVVMTEKARDAVKQRNRR